MFRPFRKHIIFSFMLVLAVAAAVAFFLLTRQSPTANLLIPDTGNQFVSVPIELERGYNLKVDQSQYKSKFVNPGIPITGKSGKPVPVPIELERGYNLKENQSQYK